MNACRSVRCFLTGLLILVITIILLLICKIRLQRIADTEAKGTLADLVCCNGYR